ncbi:hypothetical protein AB837_00061 [bacterium AB1]|nr:hypothetical protein AB837_00061 [bacterium AB1]
MLGIIKNASLDSGNMIKIHKDDKRIEIKLDYLNIAKEYMRKKNFYAPFSFILSYIEMEAKQAKLSEYMIDRVKKKVIDFIQKQYNNNATMQTKFFNHDYNSIVYQNDHNIQIDDSVINSIKDEQVDDVTKTSKEVKSTTLKSQGKTVSFSDKLSALLAQHNNTPTTKTNHSNKLSQSAIQTLVQPNQKTPKTNNTKPNVVNAKTSVAKVKSNPNTDLDFSDFSKSFEHYRKCYQYNSYLTQVVSGVLVFLILFCINNKHLIHYQVDKKEQTKTLS